MLAKAVITWTLQYFVMRFDLAADHDAWLTMRSRLILNSDYWALTGKCLSWKLDIDVI
jgi:hypothetical protein